MDTRLEECLHGQEGSYVLPCFWQHGEDHAVLREEIDAMQRSHIPVIRSLTITNCSSRTLYQLRLEISMTSPVMEHWEQRLPVLESGKSIEISPVPLAVQEEFLYSMRRE